MLFSGVHLFLFLLFVVGCNPGDKSKSARAKSQYAHIDSLKTNLHDPEILLRKAEGYYADGQLQQAKTTLEEIIRYYTRPQYYTVCMDAFMLLGKVNSAITTTQDQEERKAILDYTIVKKTDITFPVNNPRWVFRVRLNTDSRPTEELLKATANYICSNNYSSEMGELTIFMYLPGMDTEGPCYSLAVYENNLCKQFMVQ